MRLVALGLVMAVLVARPARAARMLYATAATPGRVDGYCLRGDGSLAPTPTVQELTSGQQPRRLLVVGSVLYVAEVDRVEAFSIRPGGGLSRLGATTLVDGMGARDVVVGAGGTMLYVPHRSRNRVVGYRLEPDGRPARDFTTCIQGDIGSSFQNFAVTNDKLYVSSSGGNGRIEVFGIAADGSLSGLDGAPLGPTDCTVASEETATVPLSARRRLQNIKAFVLVGNVIYAEDRGRRRIRAFRLQADGNFEPPVKEEGKRKQWQPAESKTVPVAQYQGLVHHRSALIGTQFFRGRIDSYLLDAEGKLRRHPARLSEADLRLTPVRLLADENAVYVAAGEFDRVLAYRLREDGVLKASTPFSSTDELEGSFPNDVAIAMLSAGCS